jgi:hypothetical protein
LISRHEFRVGLFGYKPGEYVEEIHEDAKTAIRRCFNRLKLELPELLQ